jgi:hypothetical protein
LVSWMGVCNHSNILSISKYTIVCVNFLWAGAENSFNFPRLVLGSLARGDRGSTCSHVLLLAASKWSSGKKWTKTTGLVMSRNINSILETPRLFITSTIATANGISREPQNSPTRQC